MGHPKLLRDIFQACIPRPPGHSAPLPVPEVAPNAPGPPFCRHPRPPASDSKPRASATPPQIAHS